MKKIIITIAALLLTLSLVFALVSCGKTDTKEDASQSETESGSNSGDSLAGLVFEEESDNTNTYFFGEGTYSENYKGNVIEGTYEIDGSTIRLTPNGATYNYVFGLEKDGTGKIVRLIQHEGRNFSLKEAETKTVGK